MSHIFIPKPWSMVSENAVTPEATYMTRRRFLAGVGKISLASAVWLSGCVPEAKSNPDPATHWNSAEKEIYPAKRNDRFVLDRPMTVEAVAGRYNNFYEFTQVKEDVVVHAQKLPTRPWTVEVGGLVSRPRTWDVDDLLKAMPVEERLYRHRCVEAWAMAVPWTGFPLSALLKMAEPLARATHVRLTSFYKPLVADGQLAFWNPWPYAEGLTLQEAMNELAFMAVGIYGHPLPKQHGAPIRLVTPWKYGFKSIKSVVKIELIDYRPATFWNTVQGLEYDFTANVNPAIPHPRWSQAREKMLGTEELRPTLAYNGYAPTVAHLYT
jgi:sulfoxide reductase catalytic subunit YedY